MASVWVEPLFLTGVDCVLGRDNFKTPFELSSGMVNLRVGLNMIPLFIDNSGAMRIDVARTTGPLENIRLGENGRTFEEIRSLGVIEMLVRADIGVRALMVNTPKQDEFLAVVRRA